MAAPGGADGPPAIQYPKSMTKEDFLHFPGYQECVTTLYNEMTAHALQVLRNYSIPEDFFNDLRQYGSFTTTEIYTALLLALVLTVVRSFTTRMIFKPAAEYSKLTPQNLQKMPESAWKLVFYSTMWSYCCYLLFGTNKYAFFEQPMTAWLGYEPRSVVPSDIYVFYMSQFAFYIHSIFATIYMDAWRKDSLVMLFHHFITLALIGFSFAMRYHNVGVLVLFVHDVTDICLEFTKLNVYYKDRGGRHHAINEWLSNIGFLFFASTWFVFRLYWFPLKVLWASGHGSLVIQNGVPLTTFFNVLLYVLQLMNIYWFSFILVFIYMWPPARCRRWTT